MKSDQKQIKANFWLLLIKTVEHSRMKLDLITDVKPKQLTEKLRN